MGYNVAPGYGETLRGESQWEGTAVPACGSEDVIFSGVLKFSIQFHADKDDNFRQETHLKSHETRGVGVESGTKYIIHATVKQTQESQSDGATITNVLKGSFIAKGSSINTQVTIHTVTVFDENGIPKTTVSDTDIKCNG